MLLIERVEIIYVIDLAGGDVQHFSVIWSQSGHFKLYLNVCPDNPLCVTKFIYLGSEL